MEELPKTIPDPATLIALAPEELGAVMLFLLRKRFVKHGDRSEQFRPNNLANEIYRRSREGEYSYPLEYQERVQQSVVESWAWLKTHGLVVPRAGLSGNDGWMVLSRRALKFASETEFKNFIAAGSLPKEMLHSSIRDRVWVSFLRGEYDTAVFQAVREVEIRVRGGWRLRQRGSRRRVDEESVQGGRRPIDGPAGRAGGKASGQQPVRWRDRALQERCVPPGSQPVRPQDGGRDHRDRQPSAADCR